MEAQLKSGCPHTIPHTPSGSSVAVGEVITMVDLNGIAHRPIADGDLGALAVGGGVYLCDKESGVAFTKGDKLYWDATNNRLDKTNTNKPIGFAAADAASGDTSALLFHWPF